MGQSVVSELKTFPAFLAHATFDDPEALLIVLFSCEAFCDSVACSASKDHQLVIIWACVEVTAQAYH